MTTLKSLFSIGSAYKQAAADAVSKSCQFAVAFVLSFGTASVFAAPDAATTNAALANNTGFIEDLLAGEAGYIFALLAFIAGLVAWFRTKDMMTTLGCFLVAILIVVVPGALRTFFA